jgi:hypothetical protein
MLQVRVRAHRRAQRCEAKPYPPSWTAERYVRDLSTKDKNRLQALIREVEGGRRSGFTYTGRLKYDIDDKAAMEHVYDKLGPRVMFAIARTNRRAEDLDLDDATIGKASGIALWRDSNGVVYADDVRHHFDISDETALEIARRQGQFIILKVDGRTRSFAFLEGPCFTVKIDGQGADRTFEPRPEKC